MLMRQMRNNTKIIMLVTALAFVALMVFQWGMDITGTAGPAGSLGRVGGQSVSVTQYQNSYRMLYDQIQSAQEQPITSQQNREIEDMAWDQVVNQILIREELSRRGIRVTDDEVRQAARLSPPPEFQSDPAFQNEQGQFDLVLYQQFLAQAGQDPAFLQQLELYYRDLIPRNKLIRQITSGVFIPDSDLWERYRAANEQASVTFISVSPGDRVDDSVVEVSSAEIEQYYQSNIEDYQVPARAQVRYAYIDKAPTVADTAAALERARAVRQEILDGADFADVAARESSDSSAGAGGDLGTFSRGDMIDAFDSMAFNLPVGELSEPFETGFGFHVVEVLSRDGDEAQARHILVPVERSDDSEIQLLTRADSLETLAENQPLDRAAATFGLPVREAEISEETAVLPGVGNAGEGQDWVFVELDREGPASPVFETEAAFYVVEILSESPSGTLSLEDVSAEIAEEIRVARKTELVRDEMSEWVTELRSGSVTLESLADREGLTLQSEGPFTRQDFVPGLGLATPAVGTAFGVPVGSVAGPVSATGQVVILRVDEREEADREAWEAQISTQRTQVTGEIQQARLDEWLTGLRESTRILDNREDYFRAAEEQADQGIQAPMLF